MKNEVKQGIISVMINPNHYWLKRVYVHKESAFYRLVARDIEGTVLISRLYQTERGAKIAFSKFFKPRAYRKGVKTQWSHFYTPQWERWDETVPLEEVEIGRK